MRGKSEVGREHVGVWVCGCGVHEVGEKVPRIDRSGSILTGFLGSTPGRFLVHELRKKRTTLTRVS